MLLLSITFDDPCAGGTPSSAHANVRNMEWFRVVPGQESSSFTLTTNGNDLRKIVNCKIEAL